MSTGSNKELFRGGLAKMLKEQFQVDVLLKANDGDKDGSVISAHKFVLSGRSEVFKRIFESDEIKTSAQLETITLTDMNHEELEAFIDFIYSDGSALSAKEKKHVNTLYRAADKYMIPHLRDLCRNEFLSSLSLSTALSILELAQIPFDKSLSDAAINYIVTYISLISRSNEFKEFVINHPNLTVEIVKILSQKRSICSTCGDYLYCDRCDLMNEVNV